MDSRLRLGCGPVRCVWALLLTGTVAQAQVGLGVLTGAATDTETGKPLRGVVVTANSPNLQGEQVVVTDAEGEYRLSQLPVGTYSVRFAREGYRLYSRGGIEVQADRTLLVSVQLLPETIGGEEIIVIGTSPAIDVGSTQTGLVVTEAFAQRVPIVRSAQGGVRDVNELALAAPQTQRDLYGISINGTTSPENQYLIDGLSVNDTAYGISGSRFPVEFAQQLNVITGGYLPEYGRSTGGVLSVASKSGGNEFHGSVFLTYTPGFLAQTSAVVRDNNTIFGAQTALYNAGDIGFTLGGYIVKDKLWFFVGFDPSFGRDSLQRTVAVFDVNPNGTRIPVPGGFQRTDIPSATRRYFQDTHVYPYFAKLTYLVDPDNRMSFSMSGTPYDGKAPFFSGVNGTYDALGLIQSGNVFDTVAQLNSAFIGRTLLLDVVVGWHHQENDKYPIDGSRQGSGLSALSNVAWQDHQNLSNFADREPAYTPELAAICSEAFGATRCRVAPYATGGPDNLPEITQNRFQAKAALTGLLEALGHHVLKAGIDADFSLFSKLVIIPGGVRYQAYGTPAGAQFQSSQYGYLRAPDDPVVALTSDVTTQSLTLGGFFQDSWNILDKVTVNLGVRFDSETISDGNGHTAVVLGNQWAPRIGVIWDPTYQGRSKLFASYAWYYEQVPLRLSDYALSRKSFLEAVHESCKDPSRTGNGRCDQQTPDVLAPGGKGPSKYWTAFDQDEIVDPGIAGQRTDEVVVGVEYEILASTRLGFTYTHRGLSVGIEDFSSSQGAPFSIGNPGRGIGAYLVQPARTYNAYTLSLSKTFSNWWLAQASYTYSTLNGNIAGLYTPETATPDPTHIFANVTEAFDFPQLRVNRFGPLPSDFTHQVKVYGAYQFQFSPNVGLTLGAGYNGRSGAPISALAGFPSYGPNEVFIIPRGAVGRLPWVNQLDLHATLDISFSQEMVFSVGADCFNVVGSQQVIAVDQSYVFPRGSTQVIAIPNGSMADLPAKLIDVSTGAPIAPSKVNTNFGKPTQYQTPRNFRFLARLTF